MQGMDPFPYGDVGHGWEENLTLKFQVHPRLLIIATAKTKMHASRNVPAELKTSPAHPCATVRLSALMSKTILKMMMMKMKEMNDGFTLTLFQYLYKWVHCNKSHILKLLLLIGHKSRAYLKLDL